MRIRQDVFVSVKSLDLTVETINQIEQMLLMECYFLQDSELHLYPTLIQSMFEIGHSDSRLKTGQLLIHADQIEREVVGLFRTFNDNGHVSLMTFKHGKKIKYTIST